MKIDKVLQTRCADKDSKHCREESKRIDMDHDAECLEPVHRYTKIHPSSQPSTQ